MESPPVAETAARGRAPLALALVLVLAVVVTFSRTFTADFVDWDDPRNFLQNYRWRGLTPENLAWMATSFHMGHWHPLTWLSCAIDYEIWGADEKGRPLAAGLHVTNVLLHAGGALLFFACGRRLLAAAVPGADGRRVLLGAFFAALFFAVHPLRVESVAWVTERRDVLSGLLFFATLLAWLGCVRAGDPAAARKRYRLAVLFFALGLLSKASLMVLPALLLLIDVWPLRRWRGNALALVAEKTPFLVLAAASAVWAVWGQRESAAAFIPISELGYVHRAVVVGYAWVFYLVKTVWPAELLPIYVLPPNVELMTAAYVAPAAIGGLLTVGLLALGKRVPALSVAWLTLVIAIAPTSGIVQAGPQIAADRYTYLPCLGLALLAGGALFLGPGARLPALVSTVAGAAIAAALALSAWRYSAAWQGPNELWSHMLARHPENHQGLSHMGGIRQWEAQQEKDPARKAALLRESIAYYERAHTSDPHAVHLIGLASSWRYLADAEPERFEQHVGRALAVAEEALQLAQRTGLIRPQWVQTHASLLLDTGHLPEAEQELRRVLQSLPDHVEALHSLSLALIYQGRAAEAVPLLDRAAGLEPMDARIWAALGEAHGLLNRAEAARRSWQRVLDVQRRIHGADAATDPYFQLAEERLRQLGG